MDKKVRIYDMKQKEVVNSKDCKRLGYIVDIELDLDEGKLKKIIVPGPAKMLGMFGRDKEYQINWNQIKKIGEDIILVDINEESDLVKSDY
ncbi:YlmC/YmxH family sporulation protein [Natranaerovirga hydrolytica]|uniref:YlmC/YmxH family sporulation protein n=1 Tax=Natranaerovirga hydrolytica TaxID=680378 RepID=A0A4R1N1K1_9FIRM|nr:YlmC/YmxH family sporulation protein [Natranaerovirga hydrolytica]TCK97874.1 YlmC/YmxH family sporulation protein [Natranaerovirga hydrolytica]